MPPAISLVLTYRLQLTRLYMLCHCGCQPGCLCAAGSQSLVSLFHSMCFSMCVSTRLHPEPSLMPLYSLSAAAASASDCLHCVVPRTLSAKPCPHIEDRAPLAVFKAPARCTPAGPPVPIPVRPRAPEHIPSTPPTTHFRDQC